MTSNVTTKTQLSDLIGHIDLSSSFLEALKVDLASLRSASFLRASQTAASFAAFSMLAVLCNLVL